MAAEVLRANGVTGAQMAVIDRGRVVWMRAFGMRRLEPALQMRTDTSIWAASITKGVFADYVVGHSGVALDVPVARQLGARLESFKEYTEKATVLVADPQWPLVTPRMLLAHTSGLANFAFLEPDKKMHLHAAPGAAYRYSGEGLNLLQLLVEQKQGRPLDVLMQEAMFGPLGMTRTGLIFRQEFADNVADRFGADGKFLAQTRRFPARAAGSMATTVEDLAKYAVALMNGRTVKTLTKPVVPIRTVHQFPVAGDAMEGEEAGRVGLAYGMGWGLLTKTRFGPIKHLRHRVAALGYGGQSGPEGQMVGTDKVCAPSRLNFADGTHSFEGREIPPFLFFAGGVAHACACRPPGRRG